MKIKDIALSAAYVGQRVVKAIAVGAHEVWSAVKYIVFKDPVVEQICVANFSSDGVGVTEEDAKAVTSLGNVFQGNTEITSFNELEEFENVNEIRNNEFNGCEKLESVTFGPSVAKIGSSSFESCSNLKILDMSKSSVTQIGYNACGNDTSLVSVIIPDVEGIEIAGGSAFSNCTSLRILDCSKFTLIQQSVFSNCPLSDVVRLDSVHTIYSSAFTNCEMKEMYIGKLKKCSNPAIRTCNNLEVIHLAKGASSLNVSTLPSLHTVDIESGIGITGLTLNFCPNLTLDELNFPNFTTGQFQQVKVKKAINLGKAVSIGILCDTSNLSFACIPYTTTKLTSTFLRCNESCVLIFCPIAPPGIDRSAIGNSKYIYVPDESVEAYKSASNWSADTSRIHAMSNYITFTDITSSLASDVVYNTALDVYAQFDATPIMEAGAKSMIYDLDGSYDTLKITGNGGTTSRLYCFIDENNEVITTADASLTAAPLYICIPSMARKMVICCAVSSTNVKVEIGKHVE